MPWRPSDRVRWMEVDDGIVVYDGRSGRFADLNESAAELWLVLTEAAWSPAAAELHLTSVHGMPMHEARSVIDAFLTGLARSLPPQD